MKACRVKLLIILIVTTSISSLAGATEIESGYEKVTSTGVQTQNIGFRPDYIEFITAQQIESEDFTQSDPENYDCPDNVNGWSEGSAIFDDSGVEKQFSIGMFRSSDSTNGHITATSTSHVIRNVYTSQDGNECGRLEASVSGVDSNGFDLNIEQKYSNYDEIVRYKAYQFPDNMGFEAGMIEVNSEGSMDVTGLGFQPANLHFRAGQQLTSQNSVSSFWRDPAGRSKGYTTLDSDGNVIDQQSIGTASSSDSTNAHRSIASDEYVINTVYVDQNANLMDSGEPSRLEAKVTGADNDGFTLQVDNEWSSTSEVILYRAWGFSFYDFDIGYSVIPGTSTETFNTGFEPDAIDIYAEQQIQSINNEVTTPGNSGCDNAGGWSNGYYERDDNRQWSISTGRTSDSQDSHRYGASNSHALQNLYNYDGNDCGNFDGQVTSTSSTGFEMSFNSDGNFDSNYGSEMVYYRAFNFQQSPPSIEQMELYNSSSDHKFGLVANISEGSNDINSCEITAESDSGKSITYSGTASTINDTWSKCRYEWIKYDDHTDWEDRHDNNDELLSLDVTLNASDIDGFHDIQSDSNTFPNHQPSLGSITFSNYSATHAFNVSAVLDDRDSTNNEELDNCEMEFSDYDGNTVTINPSLDYGYGSNDQAECFYSSVNSSMPYPSPASTGFEPEEEINVSLTIQDHHNKQDSDWNTNVIPNKPPVIDVVGPKDGEPVLVEDPYLTIQVDDPEGDDISRVEYRDSIEGDVIENLNSPPQQPQYSAQWQNLNLGVYEWEAEVWDQWSSSIVSGIEFERVVSQIYRIQHMIDHQYSSLIVEEGGQASLFLESDVAIDNRTVTTYLEGNGVTAQFIDGSTQKTYEVDTGNPDRFQIQVEGNQIGEQELRIITEDETVTTNTTTTFPVYVRESTTEGQSVPGLTVINLLTISLLSSLVYLFVI